MNLFLVRHAEAVDKGEDGVERDFDRHLTPRGVAQAAALADALKDRGVVVGAVVTSPLVRAKQTAAALADVLTPGHEPDEADLLAPDALKPRKLSKLLAAAGMDAVVAVGHLPDLADYLGWLVGVPAGVLHLDKCGCACVRFPADPAKGDGSLAWVVSPDWYMTEVKAGV